VAASALAVPSPKAPGAQRAEQTGSTRRLLVICSAFFFLYVGLEIGFAGWILTYVEELDFSAATATAITTVFWVAFTAGRLISAVVVNTVRPKTVMIAAGALTLVAASVLVVGAGRLGAVAVGAGLMGLATAPQFPVMLAYIERRMRLSGSDNAWFVGSAGLGGLVFPFVTGQIFEGLGTSAFPWTILVAAMLTVGAFAFVNRTFGG
jgi:FHS family Na+ dependent glucose MFS transporter 1